MFGKIYKNLLFDQNIFFSFLKILKNIVFSWACTCTFIVKNSFYYYFSFIFDGW